MYCSPRHLRLRFHDVILGLAIYIGYRLADMLFLLALHVGRSSKRQTLEIVVADSHILAVAQPSALRQ